MSDWPQVRLDDVLILNCRAVEVEAECVYPVVGVLNRGRGLLYREAITGAKTKYKTLNRIGPSQVVYSRLKAFEGAIAVAPEGLGDAYASPEFPTFDCKPGLLADYFALLTTTPRLWDELKNVSTGMGGRRERVKPKDFLALQINLPPRRIQDRIVALIGSMDEQIDALVKETDSLGLAYASLRELIFSRQEPVLLSEVCSIQRRLVDPRAEAFADLLHVGIDSIGKEGGDITASNTARQDNLVSGKYHFEDGDVIFSKIRPNLRKVAVGEGMGLCSADAYPLTPVDGLPPETLREALLTREFCESAVAKSARTKMPKINRNELFSLAVPLGDSSVWASLGSPLLGMRGSLRSIRAETESLRAVRAATLSALLNRELEIPEPFDGLLTEGATV